MKKNTCYETSGEISDLIKQAEQNLAHLEEDSVGYYYYWMLEALKQLNGDDKNSRIQEEAKGYSIKESQ